MVPAGLEMVPGQENPEGGRAVETLRPGEPREWHEETGRGGRGRWGLRGHQRGVEISERVGGAGKPSQKWCGSSVGTWLGFRGN